MLLHVADFCWREAAMHLTVYSKTTMLMLQYTCNNNEHAAMLAKNNESGNEEMENQPSLHMQHVV